LASFVDPRQAFGPDKIIPPNVLANAKVGQLPSAIRPGAYTARYRVLTRDALQGLAILTVFKAGFLGTARFGSGVVVARLADGSWSAPTAIGTIGGGFGGQIGFELTDFVFILNDASAVRTFAQAGSLTLGGNVSIAAGPVGRNAEAAGAASLKSVAGIFSYSKTKGLFAGVSLEGSGIIERRDANEKLYGRRWTAREILSGQVPPPPAAEPLLRVLNSRVFSGVGGAQNVTNDAMYNDIPVYDDAHDNVVWQGRRGSAMGEGVRRDRTGSMGQQSNDYDYRDRPQQSTSWADDVYDRQPSSAPGGLNRSFSTRANPTETFDRIDSRHRSSTFGDDYSYSDRKPGRPSAPKPVFGQTTGQKKAGLQSDQAIAKFTFDADQPGDLGFKKGEIITIVKRTDNETDWWTGRIGNREGIFPRYVSPHLPTIFRFR
jgi:lipid-binding SYLF domain-containing protein